MKNIICGMLALVLVSMALGSAGCGRKAEAPAVDPRARQLVAEGTAYLKQGDVVKAVQSFAMSIKASPDNFDAYYMLGETFIRLKQFPQAQAVLKGAVDRFPANPLAFYLLAVAYEGSDNMMPAIVAARKSLDIFQARGDEEGARRAMILLAALVQSAKKQAETDMVNNAAEEAARASAKAPAAAPAAAE